MCVIWESHSFPCQSLLLSTTVLNDKLRLHDYVGMTLSESKKLLINCVYIYVLILHILRISIQSILL